MGSFFEVDVFPLENRSTIQKTFDSHIFEKYIDTIIISLLTVLWLFLSIRGKTRILSAISYGSLTAAALLINFSLLLDTTALVSIPIIASFFVYNHFLTEKIIPIQKNFFMNYFSFMILCIAVAGVIVTILTLSSSSIPTEWKRNYSLDIFLIFSSFSAALIIFLTIGSLIKLLTINRTRKFKIRIKEHQIITHKVKQRTNFLFLLLFMLLSIFVALLPHQSFINNENELVGADTVDIVKWLNIIVEDDQGDFIHQAFVVLHSGDIPLFLLLSSQVITIFPENSYQAIDHLPIILSPMLVLTVFFLTREITSNDTMSLFAAFLTAISFQPLTGIYGGFYANWLALIFGYLSFVFLFRFLKKSKSKNYLIFSVLLFLMALSHVYTWALLTLFLGIFLLVSYRLKMFERKRVALVFLIIVAVIAFDAGKSIMTDAPFGIERGVNIVNTDTSYGNLASIWTNLSQASLVYAGGILGNFLILSLCIYWLIRSNAHELPNLFIIIFLSIAILPILFGDEIIQSRLLFNIPFQIPAAIGLAYLANQHRGGLLVFSIAIWILVMSIQAVINFI